MDHPVANSDRNDISAASPPHRVEIFHAKASALPTEAVMTQAQFYTAIAEGSGVSKVQVRQVFDAVTDLVTKRLKSEGKIPLGGLGAVKLVDRKARMGRNP